MISIKKLSKTFTPNKVVKNISLDIKPGEIIGLLGPNGAGKTTTIRMIAGVLPPTSGEVLVDDKSYEEYEQELKQQIGYLPENNPLYDDMTVEEHLEFWAGMKGLDPEKAKKSIKFAVESTNLEDVYYRFIGELSKGYRQRVGLAQAILGEPDILLLDEPTEGLDPNQRRDIQKLLSKLKEERTVIVSSHVLGEISHIANRIIIINKGEVVGDDTPDNLTKAQKGVSEILVEIDGKGVKKKLEEIEEVSSVSSKTGDRYLIKSESKKDLRKDIFELAVAEKWTLLEMQQVTRSLEEVFSELTEQ